MIFGKMLNLSGFQTCHCKQERLDEGDFKELKDVEVPRVGERSYRSSEWYKGYDKGASHQSRESVLGGMQTVSREALALSQRPA